LDEDESYGGLGLTGLLRSGGTNASQPLDAAPLRVDARGS
jgi:hypothetical protein